MGESKKALTKSEVHALFDERILHAMNEAGQFLGTALPDLIAAIQSGPNERAKLVIALLGMADNARHARQLAIAALAEGLAAGLESE